MGAALVPLPNCIIIPPGNVVYPGFVALYCPVAYNVPDVNDGGFDVTDV